MNEDYLYQPDQSAPSGPIGIQDLNVEPYPEGRRVRAAFRITGSRDSLAAEVVLTDQSGEELADANIVNIFNPQIEVTLHLPADRTGPGEYLLQVTLVKLQEVASEREPEKIGAIDSQLLAVSSASFTIP